MELEFVNKDSLLYKEAVNIRIEAFFKGMSNASQLINDPFENTESHYLVAVETSKVVATGRLHVNNDRAVISQMAVSKSYQAKGYGAAILKKLLEKAKHLKCKQVHLNARETAISFYEKQGFISIGKKYPSQKTRVIHRNMFLAL